MTPPLKKKRDTKLKLSKGVCIFIGDPYGWSMVKGKWEHHIITVDNGGVKHYKNGRLLSKTKI